MNYKYEKEGDKTSHVDERHDIKEKIGELHGICLISSYYLSCDDTPLKGKHFLINFQKFIAFLRMKLRKISLFL